MCHDLKVSKYMVRLMCNWPTWRSQNTCLLRSLKKINMCPLSSKTFIHLLNICLSIIFYYVYMCAYVWTNAHDCSVNKGPKMLLDLWSWVYSQLRTGCWDLSPVSLQNQYILSTVELSFQPKENVDCNNYFLLRCIFPLKVSSTLVSFCGSPFISQLLCCYYHPAIVTSFPVRFL